MGRFWFLDIGGRLVRLFIGGCRGAFPNSDIACRGYGADTTSFLIEGEDESRVLIDLGTGARLLNRFLQDEAKTQELLVLMTHYHLDHLAGLPALGLLHDPAWSVSFVGQCLSGQRVEAVMKHVLTPPFSPLRLDDYAARIEFTTLPEADSSFELTHNSLLVRYCSVNHPGGGTAYRIEENDRSIVVATDVESALASPEQRESLQKLCSQPRPADLLVMDGQYSRETYPGHEGWGA